MYYEVHFTLCISFFSLSLCINMYAGPDNFNGVLSKVAARLRDYFAKYDAASRGRRKFAVLGECVFSLNFGISLDFFVFFVLRLGSLDTLSECLNVMLVFFHFFELTINPLILFLYHHCMHTVGGGSFNPLTRMHLRTYFLAKQCLEAKYGYVVLGECVQ